MTDAPSPEAPIPAGGRPPARRWRNVVRVGLALALAVGCGWWLRSNASGLEGARPEPTPSAEDNAALDGSYYTALIDTGQVVVRVDNPVGGLVRVELPRTAAGHPLARALRSWATYDLSVFVVRTPRGELGLVLSGGRLVSQIGPAESVLAGSSGRAFWVVRAVGARRTLQEVELDGRASSTFDLPPGFRAEDTARGLVLLRRLTDGALAWWEPGGARANPVGDPANPTRAKVLSSARDEFVLGDDCPRVRDCRRTLVNLRTRVERRVEVPAPFRALSPPQLSRDAQWIATVVDPDSGDDRAEAALAVGSAEHGGEDAAIVAGTRYRLPAGDDATVRVATPVWSFDGRVFGSVRSGDHAVLVTFTPGAKQARRLEMDPPFPDIVAVRAV